MKGYKWREQASKAKPPFRIQDKLNGVRYQAEKDASRSTGGEIFFTTPHIREELAPMFVDYPELFVDGEAFNYKLRGHLNRLTELVSVCYKEKDLTPELLSESKQIVEFHVFDAYGFEGITKDTPWIERHAAIAKLLKKYAPKYVHILPYKTVNTVKEIMEMLEKNKAEGGEGLMVRWGDCPRKEGKSTMMLKLKHSDDDEFKIVDFEEGNGAYAGCVKAVILELNEPSTRGETTFRSNIEGDIEWLRELWVNKKKYIGEDATTEFQNYSEYGIPQIPYVRAVRNYEKTKKK
jgi:ATP-dependent DNA ligase